MMFFGKIWYFLLLGLIKLISTYPIHNYEDDPAHLHRVQIRVYRGPENVHHHFAPWGYFIQQPADQD
ncbi:hypothetical protein DMENIID0001_169420 [Sergentomyia squamirostris]